MALDKVTLRQTETRKQKSVKESHQFCQNRTAGYKQKQYKRTVWMHLKLLQVQVKCLKKVLGNN